MPRVVFCLQSLVCRLQSPVFCRVVTPNKCQHLRACICGFEPNPQEAGPRPQALTLAIALVPVPGPTRPINYVGLAAKFDMAMMGFRGPLMCVLPSGGNDIRSSKAAASKALRSQSAITVHSTITLGYKALRQLPGKLLLHISDATTA